MSNNNIKNLNTDSTAAISNRQTYPAAATETGTTILNQSADFATANSGRVDFVAREISCSVQPIIFDESLCIGCNSCAEVCQVDILVPNEIKGKPPLVLYPGECYYCGSCVMACKKEGAITLRHPLMNKTKFVDVI